MPDETPAPAAPAAPAAKPAATTAAPAAKPERKRYLVIVARIAEIEPGEVEAVVRWSKQSAPMEVFMGVNDVDLPRVINICLSAVRAALSSLLK